MTKQDVEELIDKAIEEAIVADVPLDELQGMLDDKKDRLEEVRAFRGGE